MYDKYCRPLVCVLLHEGKSLIYGTLRAFGKPQRKTQRDIHTNRRLMDTSYSIPLQVPTFVSLDWVNSQTTTPTQQGTVRIQPVASTSSCHSNPTALVVAHPLITQGHQENLPPIPFQFQRRQR